MSHLSSGGQKPPYNHGTKECSIGDLSDIGLTAAPYIQSDVFLNDSFPIVFRFLSLFPRNRHLIDKGFSEEAPHCRWGVYIGDV
jgi:hypothetical protein